MTLDNWLPIHTLNGTKWVPTFISAGTCTGCPVYHECQRDVARGDFAWCENVIPADYELTNSEHTVPFSGYTAHALPQRPLTRSRQLTTGN